MATKWHNVERSQRWVGQAVELNIGAGWMDGKCRLAGNGKAKKYAKKSEYSLTIIKQKMSMAMHHAQMY